MPDKKNNKRSFTNEDTLVRRAWVESALASVRGRPSTANPDADIAGSGARGGIAEEPVNHSPAGSEAHDTATGSRPRLYVAWSSPARRSGT